MTAKILIDKLMEHYNINTISELAEILKIGQPAISKWKINNSITPIRKKCKEIGIYDKIFLDNTNKIWSQKDTDTISENSNELSKYFKALKFLLIMFFISLV